LSEELFDEEFISKFIDRFRDIEREIPKEAPVEGKERNFKHSLASHLFDFLLGWTREEGRGHYVIGEVKDITFYDDEIFPVIIVETKSPDIELSRDHEKQLEGYLEVVGSARYGVLTNWHKFWLYEYSVKTGLKNIVKIDVDAIIRKGAEGLSYNEKTQVLELKKLDARRFVKLEDSTYFERHRNEIPVLKEKEAGVDLLTENLGKTIGYLTNVMERFFDVYWKRDAESRTFLKKAFSDWLRVSGKEKDWEVEGKKPEIKEVFCKETSYVIIGRFLFTRICEDKEITDCLISGVAITRFLKAGINYLDMLDLIYKRIEEYYEHFYELGIFDWWRLEDIERGTLSEEERSKQNDLEKELNIRIRDCLKVLNRFDFSRVDKDILKDVYQRYLPREERKRLGEFYTPDEVITYILDAVGYTTNNDVENKFLLDPACGSGSFLVESVRRLIRRFESKGFNLKDPVQTRQALEEITRHIYGVDINPFACFIAEMNMLFQIVDLFEVVRKKYPSFRLNRFNICTADSLTPPLTEEQKQKMELELVRTTNSRAKAFIEEHIKADEIKEMKFDFVVGNPPYVRLHELSEEDKKYYRQAFESAKGQFDLYLLFIEQGIKWLNLKGNFGFIVPRFVLFNKQMSPAREFVLSTCKINEIADIGMPFEESETENIIIHFQKEENDETRSENKVKLILNIKDFKKRVWEETSISQKVFIDLPYKAFNIFLNEKSTGILRKMENQSSKLEKIAEIRRGIEWYKTSECVASEQINENYAKVLLGEDTTKYRIKFEHVFIDTTNPRVGRMRKYMEVPEKLLVRRVSSDLVAAYDDEQYYALKNLYVILPKDEDKLPLKFILAILNSKLMNYYYKTLFTTIKQEIFPEIREFQLSLLPIRDSKSSEEKMSEHKIMKRIGQILRLNKELNTLEEKVPVFPDSYISGKGKKLWIVAKAVPPKLSKESYKFSENDLEIERFKELTGEESYRLRIAKNENIVFKSSEEAKYVQMLLRKSGRISKDKLIALEIPAEEELNKAMKEHKQDMATIEEIKKSIDELEEEVNILVYDIYGLDADDKKIIKDYLTKF